MCVCVCVYEKGACCVWGRLTEEHVLQHYGLLGQTAEAIVAAIATVDDVA